MIHPIEVESYRILESRVDLSHLGPVSRAVVSRIIHASADVEYATTTVVDEAALVAAVDALAAGAPVVADVEMVRSGITGVDAHCHLSDAVADPAVVRHGGAAEAQGRTRSAEAMRIAAERHPTGAIVVVGCAPTALFEVLDLAAAGRCDPALVIGLPVGFVGAAESKEALRASGLPAVSNVGEKGGSAVAAGALNALVRLAAARSNGSTS